jgi:hypothetical protein
MRLTAFGLAAVIAASAISAALGAEPNSCVQSDPTKTLADVMRPDFIEHAELYATTKLLPAGSTVDFVLQRPYDPQLQYHPIAQGNGRVVHLGSVIARKAPDDNPLIKNGTVTAPATIITTRLPYEVGGFWQEGSVHVLGCKGTQFQFVASVYMPISSRVYSSLLVWPFLAILYGFAAFAAATVDKQNLRWFHYLDPVVLTAGANGKGSLTNLQVLFFSVIVVGLVAYIVARTGILSELSLTILTLLGISSGSAAVSKATDANRNRIDFQNWAWFIRKGWLPPTGISAINDANWKDILTTDGQFDVYHFQSLTFSLAVGGALLANGFSDLASFTIPDALLGVLGLSQVAYIAGKIVAPPSIKDLNDLTAAAREAEREFTTAANRPDPAAPPGTPPVPPADLVEAIRRAGADKYAAYIDKAKNLKIMFRSVLGPDVPDNLIQPAIRLF